jgi:hypothetical protein
MPAEAPLRIGQQKYAEKVRSFVREGRDEAFAAVER